MKKLFKISIFILLLASPIIIRVISIINNNSNINPKYYTIVKYDNFDICNFGDFRFAIRKYDDSTKFLYDRKEEKILYSNISNYFEKDNCVYMISNDNDNVLKLNYKLNNIFEGSLDSFDNNDQNIFKNIKNKKSSVSNYFDKVFKDKNTVENEKTLAYFGDGAIRIQKTKENQYALVNIKNNELIDIINKFYFINNPIYNSSDDLKVNPPILYCIGNKGYIRICFSYNTNYININTDLKSFDSDDQNIFDNVYIDWTSLN